MEFMLGCNYWDSAHGTEMWKHFDSSVIEGDMKALSECGIKYLRVFPNWRDFQPVKQLYQWRMRTADCVTADEEKFLADKTGVDRKQIENFCVFADICDKYDIKLIVSVLTGWMSGKMFTPPIVDGKNPISDPSALMWTERYIRGFVSGTKHLKNIIMWDLGNECNCLGESRSREESFVWTAFVRNAIKAADDSRPIASGMHGLVAGEDPVWTISDQGELTDYMTTHPYVSPSVNNDYDPANKMRSTIFPTIQSIYYSDLGGKPVIMQEQNSFTDTTANPDMSADFARVNIMSCISHGIKGHFWWCAHEYFNLDYPPYAWSMMERSLGLLDLNRKPKKVGETIFKASKTIRELPFKELSERETDGVCIVSQNDRWNNASVCMLLAKQAGLDLSLSIGDTAGVYPPESDLYIIPGVAGWSLLHKHAWEKIISAVRENGATLFITYDGGSLIQTEEILGLRPEGNVKSAATHTAKFSFGKLTYKVNQELILKSVGAEVLAENEDGNIVFSKHGYGNGTVYFLNFPLEKNLFTTYNAFNDTDWYKIYKVVAEKQLAKKIAVSENPQIIATLHKVTEEKYVVCAVNYSDKPQINDFTLKNGWSLAPIYGDLKDIPKCDGAFYYAIKKK